MDGPTFATLAHWSGGLLPVGDGLGVLATTGAPPGVGEVAGSGAPAGRVGTPLYNYLSSSLPGLLMVAGAVVITWVVVGRLRAAKAVKPPSLEERFARLVAERDRTEPAAPRPLPAARGTGGVAAGREPPPEPTLDAVIRDTEELAQRLAAAMDARAERLESLIRQADDRLRRLEQARAAAPVEPAMVEPRRSEPARTPRAAGAARPGVLSLESDTGDPIQRQVFELADQGCSALEIARRLGQPTGQVELMLALRGR